MKRNHAFHLTTNTSSRGKHFNTTQIPCPIPQNSLSCPLSHQHLENWGRGDHAFKASLRYIVRPHLRQKRGEGENFTGILTSSCSVFRQLQLTDSNVPSTLLLVCYEHSPSLFTQWSSWVPYKHMSPALSWQILHFTLEFRPSQGKPLRVSTVYFQHTYYP